MRIYYIILTYNAGMAEQSNARVCKTRARKGYVGANPTPSTIPLSQSESHAKV